MKSLQLLARRSITVSSKPVRCTPRLFAVQRARYTPVYRRISTSSSYRLGLSPESSEPKPPNPENHEAANQEAAQLTDAEYHEIADQYMNALVLTLEEISDDSKALEVEYSAGVLTINHTTKGDYVLNKQPPNKQIWLSSPQSGPKRYDWVISSSGMHSKQDTEGATGERGDDGTLGGGHWTYIRDGSRLSDLLKEELDVVVAHEESDVTTGREGPGGSGASTGPVEG